jgi:hypothetical protein
MPKLDISVFEKEDITNKIVKDYKITKDTEPKYIKNCILKYILNNLFNQLILFGHITKKNEFYIFGNYKTHNEIDIMKCIINDSENKLKLKKIIDCLFDSIEKYFKIEAFDLETQQNLIQLQKINKMRQKLEDKKKKIEEMLDTQNSTNLEIIYKQSRIQTEMENEMFNTDLHVQEFELTTDLIIQTYTSQIGSLSSQIIKRQTQRDIENQNRIQKRHFIENLKQEISNAEITHKNEEAKKEQLEQGNILQQHILNENIDLRNDLNHSFVKIIDVMKEQNEALITAIETTSKSTRDVITKTSEATAETIKSSGKSIEDAIHRETATVQDTIKQNTEKNIIKLNEVTRLIMEQNRQKEELNRKLDQILTRLQQQQQQPRQQPHFTPHNWRRY